MYVQHLQLWSIGKYLVVDIVYVVPSTCMYVMWHESMKLYTWCTRTLNGSTSPMPLSFVQRTKYSCDHRPGGLVVSLEYYYYYLYQHQY